MKNSINCIFDTLNLKTRLKTHTCIRKRKLNNDRYSLNRSGFDEVAISATMLTSIGYM